MIRIKNIKTVTKYYTLHLTIGLIFISCLNKSKTSSDHDHIDCDDCKTFEDDLNLRIDKERSQKDQKLNDKSSELEIVSRELQNLCGIISKKQDKFRNIKQHSSEYTLLSLAKEENANLKEKNAKLQEKRSKPGGSVPHLEEDTYDKQRLKKLKEDNDAIARDIADLDNDKLPQQNPALSENDTEILNKCIELEKDISRLRQESISFAFQNEDLIVISRLERGLESINYDISSSENLLKLLNETIDNLKENHESFNEQNKTFIQEEKEIGKILFNLKNNLEKDLGISNLTDDEIKDIESLDSLSDIFGAFMKKVVQKSSDLFNHAQEEEKLSRKYFEQPQATNKIINTLLSSSLLSKDTLERLDLFLETIKKLAKPKEDNATPNLKQLLREGISDDKKIDSTKFLDLLNLDIGKITKAFRSKVNRQIIKNLENPTDKKQ